MGLTRVWWWSGPRGPWGRCALRLLIVMAVAGAIAGCGASSGSQPTSSKSAARKTTNRSATVVGTTTSARLRTSSHGGRRRPRRVAGSAVDALATLPVKGRAPMTGYERLQFGDGWATVAGCDVRDRILARDLTDRTYEDGSGCYVRSGILTDPYTSERIRYVRGGASEVDIDHVVALGDAWQKGAQQWPSRRRAAFANDPLNLLAVSAPANRAKGDGDAATWLPPNKSFRCDYVAREIAVKQRYGAWVTRAEHDAIARVLASCPEQQLPKAAAPPPSPTSSTPTPAAGPSKHTTTAPPNSGGGRGRVFANCAAVRAAGLAPLRRGTADYGANQRLDRDKDGLACE
jgi:Protein of unknown function (DUF1524)/Excalibur calcium-binding domain